MQLYMRFLCTSDLHSDFESLKKLTTLARGFDAVIVAGDLTNFSSSKVANYIVREIKAACNNLLIVPGNCELHETLEMYRELGLSLHGTGKVIGEVGFFGLGGSNPTPFNTPIEFGEDDIKKLLKKGYESIKEASIKVLVSHPPPIETVDMTSGGVCAGSRALREFVEKNKIDLVICGHIHEARGSTNLNDTYIVNTGPTCRGYVEVTVGGEGRLKFEFAEL